MCKVSFSRMDGKPGEVICGSWLAVEQENHFKTLQAKRRNSCSA